MRSGIAQNQDKVLKKYKIMWAFSNARLVLRLTRIKTSSPREVASVQPGKVSCKINGIITTASDRD